MHGHGGGVDNTPSLALRGRRLALEEESGMIPRILEKLGAFVGQQVAAVANRKVPPQKPAQRKWPMGKTVLDKLLRGVLGGALRLKRA